MLNTEIILNRTRSRENKSSSDRYIYSSILINGTIRDFIKSLSDAKLTYKADPDMFYATLRMKDAFMHKIPKGERATVIEDITQEFIARLNNHLIKHPERRNQQQFKIRPHTVIENRDAYGNAVMEHSHTILMLHPSIRRNLEEPSESNALQLKADRVQRSSKPFQTITHDHTVHLLNDLHSVKIDHLTRSEDVENTLGYNLKTALLTDDQNAFTILDYNSQEKFYEKKRDQRQSADAQTA